MDKKLHRLKLRQDAVMGQMAEILASVSSPVRIKLIHFLSQGPLTVDTLAGKIGQSVANTSMHLRKMHATRLVTVSVAGKHRLYALHPAAFAFWEACQDFTQEVAPELRVDAAAVYGEIDWEEDLRSTVRMAKNNEVTLVDARPADEASQEISGLNVLRLPADGLAKLPKKRPLLVFCRGRLCALSAHVVGELRKQGYQAYRLNESWYALNEVS